MDWIAACTSSRAESNRSCKLLHHRIVGRTHSSQSAVLKRAAEVPQSTLLAMMELASRESHKARLLIPQAAHREAVVDLAAVDLASRNGRVMAATFFTCKAAISILWPRPQPLRLTPWPPVALVEEHAVPQVVQLQPCQRPPPLPHAASISRFV